MKSNKNWSNKITKGTPSLLLPVGIFTWSNPIKIAKELLKSAKESTVKKAESNYKSAMSMLSFYVNRAGKNLTKERKDILLQAKVELKKICKKNNL